MRPETRLSYVAVASSAGRLELWRLNNNPDNPSIAEAVLINPNEPSPSFGWSVAAGGPGPDGTSRLYVTAPDEGGLVLVYVYSDR